MFKITDMRFYFPYVPKTFPSTINFKYGFSITDYKEEGNIAVFRAT